MLPGVTPYRIDMQQGNVVTQEMIDKLKPGMTRQQVRFVLGTPPLVDPFRTDRWDYVYLFRKGSVVTEQRRLILLFDGDVLARIDGDVIARVPGAQPTSPASSPKPPDGSKPGPVPGGAVERPREPAAQ